MTFRALIMLVLLSAVSGLWPAPAEAARGASPPEAVTISNAGAIGSVLDISSVALDDDTHFSLVAGGSCPLPPFDLDGGESCTQLVVFDPQTTGPLAATLLILSDADSIINDQVALSGNGTPGPSAALDLSPDPLDFGLLGAPDLPASADISISNVGDPGTSLEVDAVGLAGDAEFSISADGCTGLILNQGESCTVSIGFNASSPGTFSGQFQVDSTAGSASADLLAATPLPDRLAFVVQPTDSVVDQAIAPPLVVEVQDSSGNRVSLDNSTVVQLDLAVDPTGSASLSGPLSVQVTAGQATFPGLSIDRAGSGFAVLASDSPSSLTAAGSMAFDILPASSTTTITSVSPPGSQVVGQAYTVSVQVAGANPSGDISVSDGQGASCQITLPASSCDLLSTTAGPRVLTALYPGDANNSPSSDSENYSIGQASAGLAIESIAPPGQQAVNTPYSVEISVSGFNPTGTVTVSDGQGATCLIVLPASSCNLSSTSVGAITVSASYPGDANNTAAGDSTAYQIVAGSPAALVFLVQPADGVSGVAIAPAVAVQVQDAFGNPVLSDDATEVTLGLTAGTPGASLGGGAPVTVTAGLAAFDALSVDLAGSGYRLSAAASGLSGALSDPFAIGPGSAVTLRFDGQPGNTLVGALISPPVSVSVRDAAGNLVVDDNATVVELDLQNGTPGALLGGGSPTVVNGGLASFPGLSVDQVGTGYRLAASHFNGSLAPALSNSFSITASGSTTTITAIDPIDSQTVGQAYEVIVAVAGAAPTGLVTVSDGQGASCQFSLPDDRCSLSSSTAGSVTLSASYAGDDNNGSSSDTQAYTIDQAQSQTSITGVLPASEQTIGQPYTLSVEVSGFSPQGTVVVSDQSGASCQIALPADSCALVSDSVGSRTLQASYPGDVNNTASADSLSYQIVPAASVTTILGITPPGEQVSGLAYTVTVSVSGFSAGGSVTIEDGQGASCAITLPASSCDLVSAIPGPRTITASYSGDSGNTPSSDSVPYEIVAGGPAGLAFARLPTLGIVNGPLLPGLIVQVVDSQGQPVLSDNTTVIEISIASNPSGGALFGTLSRQVSNGVADFSDLGIDRRGQGYSIQASVLSRGLSPILTPLFNVVDDALLQDRFEAPRDDVFQDRFEWPWP